MILFAEEHPVELILDLAPKPASSRNLLTKGYVYQRDEHNRPSWTCVSNLPLIGCDQFDYLVLQFRTTYPLAFKYADHRTGATLDDTTG